MSETAPAEAVHDEPGLDTQEDAEESANLFAELANDEVGTPAAEPEPTESEPVSEASPPVEEAPAVPETPAESVPAEPVEAASPTAETVEEPAPSVEPEPAAKTPEELKAEYEQWQTESRTQLANDLYAISDEDAIRLEGNLKESLPEYMAQVHMNVLTSTMQALAGGLPQLMQRHQQVATQASQAEDAFNRAWPGLNNPEYKAELVRIAGIHAQTSPNKSTEERIRDIGVQFCILKGLDPAQVGAATAAAPTAPPAPTPASGSTAAPSVVESPAPTNAFEAFAEEILHEDS